MRWDKIDTSAVTLDMLPEEGREIAEIIGVESYMKLVREYGGRSIYIHKLDAVIRILRDEQIREDFNGDNHGVLCKKYNLSEKQIREILAAKRAPQLTLF